MVNRKEALSLLFITWHLLFLTGCFSATNLNFPRLGMVRKNAGKSLEAKTQFDWTDFQIFNYTQTLDHFNYRPESYTTFQQRYVVNSRYWGGANSSSPIFVYTGDEAGLDIDVEAAGFFTDNAPRFKALLIYIEHRYYGTSVPFGSTEEAFQNSSTLGYFSSAQALADYAEIITYLKKNLSAENCPVIVAGGSYGGMLASWFRLKYPHIAYGALASSAPILYFEDIIPEDAYYSVVTRDFRESNESCYNTIRQSWFEIDKMAILSNGLTVLSQIFKTCSPLESSQELKGYLESLYSGAAQYDFPPQYPVDTICNGIDGAPPGKSILSRIFAGIVAFYGELDCYFGEKSQYQSQESFYTPEELDGWHWQVCSEMVIPIGRGSNDTMFQAQPFDLKSLTEACQAYYGVIPRPHWITTEYGGHNIKSVLQRFGSNIIFSNGLRDPYSSGGVLQNISDSIVAIYTAQGAHCLDILSASPNDPTWLVSQRNSEVEIIAGWIAQYNSNLTTSSGNQT
ncbi:uncharacterized protein LOC143875921 [Tasmannia lanceolata]|uniref:uncharacterized protein LOC143875921 n=1 Tax=Tasmannia lanceolata TaxID=3420 RepID=UPI00406366D5